MVFQNAMWLSNGYSIVSDPIRDLWRSPDGADWHLVSGQTPYDGYAEMAVYEDKIWAVRGSVWDSVDGEIWKQVTSATPFGERELGGLIAFKDRMWELGNGPNVWSTVDGVQWECACADAPYGSRLGAGVAVYRDMLWVLGGATKQIADPPERHYPQYTTPNDVWCSGDGHNWTRVVEHAPWAERMWCVATVYGGKLWLIGGFSNREHVNFAEAWYTEDGVTWRDYRTDPMFSARHAVTSYVFNGSLWVVAGNAWPLRNDVWKLDLAEAHRTDSVDRANPTDAADGK